MLRRTIQYLVCTIVYLAMIKLSFTIQNYPDYVFESGVIKIQRNEVYKTSNGERTAFQHILLEFDATESYNEE